MAGVEIVVGAKMDLAPKGMKFGSDDSRVYYSKVIDIIEADEDIRLKALMPINEGHIVPLSLGTEYQAFFTMHGNVYECGVAVSRRYKENNIYVMELEMTSELKKVQRREFYRLQCDMPVKIVNLTDGEAEAYKETRMFPMDMDGKSHFVTAVDISGGGVRIHADEMFEKESWVLVEIDIPYYNDTYRLKLIGRIIASYRPESTDKLYETRIQFRYMNRSSKEMLVKYIFQEQRMIQKRQRGNI